MKIQLKSDFNDYYDHQFDLEGEIWERMSTTDMTRRQMFERMTEMGLVVPPYGTAAGLDTGFPEEMDVVVYIDEYTHRGEGKRLCPLSEAVDNASYKLASLLIPSLGRQKGTHIESFRYLRVGTRIFWMRYKSHDEWRSNCGDVEISLTNPPPRFGEFRDKEPYPLIAIDFVPCIYGAMYAVDYNTSPGLKGTPAEEEMSAEEVANEIKIWLTEETAIKEHRRELDLDTAFFEAFERGDYDE